jgi:FMN phosphatase YigB (HAD superfamily)
MFAFYRYYRRRILAVTQEGAMSGDHKTVLITDLDNTLFDWVDLWHACFTAMMCKVVEISGIPFDELKPEIRKVHQRHGTSEYSFLLEELPSVSRKLGGNSALEVFQPAIEAYRLERRKKLALYPTVAETLLKVKGSGAAVVGYTESMAFYSNYRIRRLGLDGVFDFMFSPEDHDIPASISLQDVRKYSAAHYEFRYTKQKHTPKTSVKPDASVLLKIIDDLGVDKSECVYVGDSPTKDIAMAQDANVAHAYAKYGKAQHTDAYALLREVTHWSDADVEREKRIGERQVQPNIVLESDFGQLLRHFKFGDWNGR